LCASLVAIEALRRRRCGRYQLSECRTSRRAYHHGCPSRIRKRHEATRRADSTALVRSHWHRSLL